MSLQAHRFKYPCREFTLSHSATGIVRVFVDTLFLRLYSPKHSFGYNQTLQERKVSNGAAWLKGSQYREVDWEVIKLLSMYMQLRFRQQGSKTSFSNKSHYKILIAHTTIR